MSGDAGNAQGRAAILDALRCWQAGMAQSTHRWANPVLRVSPDGEAAWLSAAYHFSIMAADERRASTFGRCYGQLRRHAAGWRIADWRVLSAPAAALLPATSRSRRLSMPDIPDERDRFEVVVNRGAWSARKWLIDLPLPAEEDPLQRLTAELDVREFLTAYAAALDSKDLARVLDFFAQDAVITTGSGRFRYQERIRDYFAANFRNRTLSFHRLMNTAVRLAPSGAKAWLSTYYYAARPGQRRAGDGHMLGRVNRYDTGWKFNDVVISMDRARYFPAP
jgi:ketosteroid isomerase-like protein